MIRWRHEASVPFPRPRPRRGRRGVLRRRALGLFGLERPRDGGGPHRHRHGLTDVRLGDGHVTALLGEVAIEKVVPELVNDGVPVLGFAVLRPSLEDVFVSLTGEGFDVSG